MVYHGTTIFVNQYSHALQEVTDARCRSSVLSDQYEADSELTILGYFARPNIVMSGTLLFVQLHK